MLCVCYEFLEGKRHFHVDGVFSSVFCVGLKFTTEFEYGIWKIQNWFDFAILVKGMS